MEPITLIYPDCEAVAQKAAEVFARAAASAIAQRDRFAVALAGGNTPRAVYQRLGALQIDWPRVHLFWGDERWVPPDHPDSNFRMVSESLLTHVNIPEANVHPMPVVRLEPPA